MLIPLFRPDRARRHAHAPLRGLAQSANTASIAASDPDGAERLFSAWVEGQIAYRGLPGNCRWGCARPGTGLVERVWIRGHQGKVANDCEDRIWHSIQQPIFHRRDETIRGHVVCSFLALLLRKELEDRLAAKQWKLEWGDFIRDLDNLVGMEISINGKGYSFRGQTRLRERPANCSRLVVSLHHQLSAPTKARRFARPRGVSLRFF